MKILQQFTFHLGMYAQINEYIRQFDTNIFLKANFKTLDTY